MGIMASIFYSVKSLFRDSGAVDVDIKREVTSHHNKKKYSFICGCGNNQVLNEIRDCEEEKERKYKLFDEVIEELKQMSNRDDTQSNRQAEDTDVD